MRIILNNREEDFTGESISVSDMLRIKKFSFRLRIVKVNGSLISKDSYESTYIKDGDNIQMIYLMSGG
jgi:thiamine biosynthesis protein ThiS